jgi:dipeptidyl aminopeptidase/acylaminoacyl peptidase
MQFTSSPSTVRASRFPRFSASAALAALCATAVVPVAESHAQPPSLLPPPTQTVRVNRANWTLADRFSVANMRNLAFSTSVAPRWLGESDSMFYNWRDKNGGTFYLVVPTTRTKRPLFDHVKLAEELSRLHRKPYEHSKLPFTTLNFTKDHKKIRFQVDSTRYEWNLAAETLTSLGIWRRDSVAVDEEREQGAGGGGQGGPGGAPEFRNFSPDSTAFAFAREHNLFVVDVKSGDTVQLSTDGVKDYSFGFRDTATTNQQQQDDDQQENQNTQGQQSRSRDPRVRASVSWSPDSRSFTVQRNDSRKVKELYLVNVLSNPRPTLSSYKYAMPGEEDVSQQELFVFTRGEKSLRKVPVDKWKDQRVSNVHWPVKSETFRLVRRDRLQRNMELVEVNTATLAMKTLLTESVENAFLEIQPVRYVTRGGDFVWFSERSGWGHYYLYSHDGTFKRALTNGMWRAENVVDQDTVRGTMFISGVGREPGPNPYLRHTYRMNGDGSGFTHVTPGAYDHATRVSPTKRFIVDNYSRSDTLPVAVVRDATTGRVVMPLEVMDDSRIREMGWVPPVPFTTKAADGTTDIYGNMWKPADFDSTKKYPIIAYVYPGPQTEQVTSGFSTGGVMQQLAQLGFVVIQIGNRGGTPQRSNAYHSFGYYNLRDYALADKKTGIEQLAARHSFIDIDRVGIYGHSGGGFLTAAALMLPPYNDFFKVGVSSAGNHDNNIYNQNWSEQHHGLRVITERRDTTQRGRGNGANGGARTQTQQQGRNGARVVTVDDSTRYEIRVPTNAELAANLKGNLLLVHGDMDNNVHPGNTTRLVDALIKANKRFDMMMLPGQAHGFGPMQPYFNRMLMEFFAEHLMGDYYRATAEIR